MPKLRWLRSSFCEEGGNNCVEIAATDHNGIAIRESDSPALIVTTDRSSLRALFFSVRAGRFDGLPD